MSQRLINRSPDLKRLRDEGYHVEIRSGYVLLRDVPYVNAAREIKRGILISPLTLANDVAQPPQDHVAIFAGEYPCDAHGTPIEKIRLGDLSLQIGDIMANFNFSAKPQPCGKYPDIYAKMTAYANILAGPAQAIDPDVTPKSYPVYHADDDDESVFRYIDCASSRADITAITAKLELGKVGILGIGGTGSYVLDLVAKTPVAEIHLWDGDTFLQHNAFRAPGAASGDELDEKLNKADYFHRIYDKMRQGIVVHPHYLAPDNLDELAGLDFAFVTMEGPMKRLVIEKLEAFGIPYIDVGMGLYVTNGSLGGIVRTTTSTPEKRDHVWLLDRIPFSDGAANEYNKSIQIADLNALNAALAVIRWKKHFGFYLDQEREHYSCYGIGGNHLVNEDRL